MTNQTSLEDLLSDRELPETTEETEQTKDTGEVTSEETATAETEQETEEKDDSTPESKAEQKTEDEEGPESWTKAAVLDERRKRQALEAELEQLKQGKQPAAETEKPDWYGDPEKAAQVMQQQVGQTVSQQVWQTKVGLSQDLMRSQHEDYDELESEFMDLVKEQPGLVQEMLQAPNPARFAYDTAKKAREYTAMKDVDAYKAKMRQEIEAKVRKELEAEQQQKADKQQQKRAAIDPSLASSTSQGLKSDDFAGPTPLDDILNG